MINNSHKWQKLGQIIKPDPGIPWMSTYTGPATLFSIDDNGLAEIYVTGRDQKNRSQIGKIIIDINEPSKALNIIENPVFTFGELGSFDENGVSYPNIVCHGDDTFMYYVGWMPTVLTPFQNHIGLAKLGHDNQWRRVSRAPILERTNDEYQSLGSVSVIVEQNIWKMWYTCFLRWGEPHEHKHYYVIKYAESKDGITWVRPGNICINIENTSEYAIGKPSVIKLKDLYHMWYSYRGEQYRIGYAWSKDGIHWTRRDDLSHIGLSPDGWDSKAICYSSVFLYGKDLYMLYNGNYYGKEGLGLGKLCL